jgi:hypothetical protein
VIRDGRHMRCCDSSVHAAVGKTVVEGLADFLLHVYLRRYAAWVCMIGCDNLLSQMTMAVVRYAVLRDTFTGLVRLVLLPGIHSLTCLPRRSLLLHMQDVQDNVRKQTSTMDFHSGVSEYCGATVRSCIVHIDLVCRRILALHNIRRRLTKSQRNPPLDTNSYPLPIGGPSQVVPKL